MTPQQIIKIGLFVLLLLFGNAAAQEEHQSHAQIEQAVRDYVEAELNKLANSNSEITLGRLNNRLKLSQCAEPLEIFSLSKFNPAGRNNIGVRCHAPRFWKIFIPATIKFYSTVAVAAIPLRRGTTITVSDVALDRRQIANHLGGYFTNINDVVGREVRQPIRLGSIIQQNATHAEKVIKKGELVTLRSSSSRFKVITSGKALNSGTLGDIIRVQNSKSERIVEGTVVAPGLVEIRN